MTPPGWGEMIRCFGKIGLLSFGGPAAQIALMHRTLVEDRNWLSEDTFLRALSLCMLLPGPEAMQLVTYAGWRLRGVAGGILGGLLFVVPGALVIAALALLYARFGQVPLVQAGFVGIKAAVIAIVLGALWGLSRRALRGASDWVIAVAAFAALFVLGVPFPLLIAAAGLWGFVTGGDSTAPALTAPQSARPLMTAVLWGALWLSPLVVLWLLDEAFLLELGLFFSTLAVVSFGGAYAVLGYMTQTVVADLGWISTAQMIDALGLAETTPGPLILVTQFVAMLAGHAQTGLAGALSAGMLALWVTFTPCFLWIFLAGPYLDRLEAQPRLSAALRTITAAVVGVIANISLWFALHVWFAEIGNAAPLALPVPRPQSIQPFAVFLTGLGALLLMWRGWSVPATLATVAGTALGAAMI